MFEESKSSEIKKTFMKILKLFFYFFMFLVTSAIFINIYIYTFAENKIYDNLEDLNPTKVGIVLGAGLKPGGIPSDILQDRLDGSLQAYEKGIIEKIVLSGDNSTVSHNEPLAMQKYLIGKGIPEEDLFLDYAGIDTRNSMLRLHEIFSVDEVIIFTQKFHLSRSVYIGEKVGISAQGFETDFRNYQTINYLYLREFFARLKAFWETEIINSSPKFGGEKIEISKNNLELFYEIS